MAHPKLRQVQQRYNHRCGYCSVSEVDTGGELSVDHYQPQAAGGDDGDDNLIYACFRCNLYKGDFSPTADDQRQGRRVLHPLLDDVTTHLREDLATGSLEPLTETGRFHIALLQLNRPALIAHRLRVRRLALEQAKQKLLEAQLAQLQASVDAQALFITALRRQFGFRNGQDE